MKKWIPAVLSLVVVASASAAPVADTAPLATAGDVIHLGTLDYSTGELRVGEERGVPDILWEATTPTGFFRNQPTATQEVLDEGDLPDEPYVGQFQIGFVTDAVGCVTLRYAFYENDQFDTVGAPLPRLDGGDAVYDVEACGLTGGGLFAYTLDVELPDFMQFQIVGPDLDMDGATDWGWGFSVVDPGSTVAGIGPSIASPGPGPSQGAADIFDVYDPPVLDPGATYGGTFFFGGAPFAQFHMQLVRGPGPPPPPAIEVPTTDRTGLFGLLALLAGIGVFVIARRR